MVNSTDRLSRLYALFLVTTGIPGIFLFLAHPIPKLLQYVRYEKFSKNGACITKEG
jgi:hypothetical protein